MCAQHATSTAVYARPKLFGTKIEEQQGLRFSPTIQCRYLIPIQECVMQKCVQKCGSELTLCVCVCNWCVSVLITPHGVGASSSCCSCRDSIRIRVIHVKVTWQYDF